MSTKRYHKEYRLRVHRVGGPLCVDAAPFRRMIEAWVNDGYSLAQIEAASGYNDDGLAQILNGELLVIRPESAEKLLATHMTPDMIPDYLTIDATGSRRRLQALAVIGYPTPVMAAELGRSVHFVSDLLREHHFTVRRRYAVQVTDLYKRWSAIPGPSKHSRTLAAKRGWHSPLAWNDIDNPNEQPDSSQPAGPEVSGRELVQLLATERAKEIRLLASAGTQPAQIAQRVGVTEQTVRRSLAANHPSLYLELTA